MTARFATGDSVAVTGGLPIGHCRTPWYVRGMPGIVERYCGDFANPEELACRRDGLPALPLYRVRIAMGDLWPDYGGPARDTLEVEIYEHWLRAPASGPQE